MTKKEVKSAESHFILIRASRREHQRILKVNESNRRFVQELKFAIFQHLQWQPSDGSQISQLD